MDIVLVHLTVRPALLAEFEAAILRNARQSIAHDAGCVRFDVGQQIDDPGRWVLHEVYAHPDAHAAHRRSAHFLAFRAVGERAIVERTVARCTGRHISPGPTRRNREARAGRRNQQGIHRRQVPEAGDGTLSTRES